MTHESTIAILGPGLLGGSVALAVRKHSPGTKVRIWGRREEAIAKIRTMPIADFASTNAQEVVAGASLIVLATPVLVMESLVTSILSSIDKHAVVTDVGSVKGSVVASLEPMLHAAGIPFVGSHPMAGSEKTGIEAATDDLFEGATCLITPTANTDAQALARVEAFWKILGGKTLQMGLDVHDRKVARISHMPHALAFALAVAALRDDPTAAEIVGNGFRDSTRIAASDPDLWTGILLENHTEVVSALTDVTSRLQEVLAMVRDGDKEKLRQFLAEAQQLRSLVPKEAS